MGEPWLSRPEAADLELLLRGNPMIYHVFIGFGSRI